MKYRHPMDSYYVYEPSWENAGSLLRHLPRRPVPLFSLWVTGQEIRSITLVEPTETRRFLADAMGFMKRIADQAPISSGDIKFEGKYYFQAHADNAIYVHAGVDYYLPDGGEHYDRRTLVEGCLAKTRRGWLWFGPTLKLLRKAADGRIPLSRVSANPTITEFYFDGIEGEDEAE